MSADFYGALNVVAAIKFTTYVFAVLLTLLLLLMGVLYWRQQFEKFLKRKYRRKLTDRFRQMIHSYVYLNKNLYVLKSYNIELPLYEFQKYNLKNRYIREVLSEVIIELNQQYPGEKKKLLRKLYKDLDMELYLLIEMNIYSPKQLASAFQNLRDLEIGVDHTPLKKFLWHKDPIVRKKAKQYISWKKGVDSQMAPAYL